MIDRYIGIAVVAVLTGVVCYLIAKKSGRNATLWFMAGIVFNFLAIGLLLLLKNFKLTKKARGDL
ncbi:MAG: hypothetical protein PHF50_00295 [Patescibacteria group bacterium]|nr:hypothetical protein [Patescibacteria group bacterium]